MRIRSVHSRRAEPIQCSAKGVHPRGPWCGEHDLDADGGEDGVEGGTELRITVANEVRESVAGVLEVAGKSRAT
jgi:hypothetical protein